MYELLQAALAVKCKARVATSAKETTTRRHNHAIFGVGHSIGNHLSPCLNHPELAPSEQQETALRGLLATTKALLLSWVEGLG